jgi:hypothetical protein
MFSANAATVSDSYTSNRPTTYDYLKPNGFRLVIQDLPHVSYFCQEVTLPDISLGSGTRSTPFINYPFAGEKVTFGDLDLTFIVSEDLTNYLELYNWMTSVGDFKDYTKRTSFLQERENKRIGIDKNNKDILLYSDGSLVILNSSNIPKINIKYTELFPVQLSPISFNSTITDIQYLTCRAVFRYRMFEFEQY